MATVLITGAGGSIGKELAKQIVRASDDDTILLLDICEYNLYKLEQEIEPIAINCKVLYLLGDVRDAMHITMLMKKYLPETVYHAAALKHVPMLELDNNAIEGVVTNVIGTKNIIEIAYDYGVKHFVMVSTDKAVNPISMMGTTKAFAEGYCLERFKQNHGDTKVSIVRFGNVIGSSGSVIPYFHSLLDEGKPLTVTHPEIVRYFMSIEEAVLLVREVVTMAEESGVYVLDMGDPIFIVDLAKKLQAERGIHSGIEFIGLRSGEKLYEELHHSYETLVATTHPRIKKVTGMREHEGYMESVMSLEWLCKIRNYEGVVNVLRSKIPYPEEVVECASL